MVSYIAECSLLVSPVNKDKVRSLSDWLRAGRSGDQISVGARFSAPVQTGPGNNTASCAVGIGSFPGVKSGQGVTLTCHPLLVPWPRKSRSIPLLPLWAVRPVQSLSACTRAHFTSTLRSFIESNTNKSINEYKEKRVLVYMTRK